MPQEKVKKIHLIYGCIAAVLIVALGIGLILSCLDIYNSGARPYSPESIGLRFQRIAILAYACIALVAGGIVLNFALPLAEKRPEAKRDELDTMNRLKAKVDGCVLGTQKEQNYRNACKKITAGLCILLAVYPAIYVCDPAHFPIEGLNEAIAKAVAIALIPALVGLVLCYVCSVLCSRSIARETELYKNAAKSTAPAVIEKKSNRLTFIRCGLLAIALIFIVLGIFNGGMKDVFDKAVAICTECVGLG